jgi:aminoglycoside phosphotransferase (APT) family kinase protein
MLAELGGSCGPSQVATLLDEAELLAPTSRSAVVHGDLHARQILVHDGHVTGVVDWVDLGRADPAVDLAILWSFVDPRDRSDFLATYGPVADDQLVRSRVVAVWLCAALAVAARDTGSTVVAADALASLERAAAD